MVLEYRYIRIAVSVFLTLIFSVSAQASDNIRFAGFASFVYAKTLSNENDEGPLLEFSDEGEYRDFNVLGLRMDADLKDNLTFTAQLVAEGESDYEPEFDWIFATINFTPELSLSIGKTRVPVYMFSDYLDVSYAYPWIKPPNVVYDIRQTPFKSIEGLKLSYVRDLGPLSSELLVYGGKTEDEFKVQGLDTTLVLEEAMGVAWTLGWEYLSFRTFYMEAETSADLTTNSNIEGLIYGAEQNSPSNPVDVIGLITALGNPDPSVFQNALAFEGQIEGLEALVASQIGKPVDLQDEILWERDPGEFYGAGLSLDFGSFFAISEVTRINVEHNLAVPDLRSAYLAVGVRVPSDFTFTLTFGRDSDHARREIWTQFDDYKGQTTIPGAFLTTGQIDAILSSVQGGVEAETKVFQDFDIDSITLSMRWDFHRSASAKFEYLSEERHYPDGTELNPDGIRLGLDLIF